MTTSYEEFSVIFTFFVRYHLDKQYIKNVDNSLKNNEATTEMKLMVQNVREFHNMRSSLIQKVYNHIGPNTFVTKFVKCTGIEQYNRVPEKSICALSNKILMPNQGMLIILHYIDGNNLPFTVHIRFKRLLYSLWFLVHLPKEIMININKWLNSQLWWKNKTIVDYNEVVRRIVCYNDEIFIKKSYIKLKDISTHIQSDIILAAKPIK